MANKTLVAVFSASGVTKRIGEEIARIIDTFLESYDFSGKKLIPFCTSGGSGAGRRDTALHKDVSGEVKWEKGRQINRANEAEIRRWPYLANYVNR